MADFHPVQNLIAYSGGTVRDFHTIPYSPLGLLPAAGHLNFSLFC